MATAKELREKAGESLARVQELRKVLDERSFNAEEQESWDKANADYDGMLARADQIEKVDALAKSHEARQEKVPGREDRDHKPERKERPVATGEDRNLALDAWCRRQLGKPLTEKHKQACKRSGMSPNVGELRIDLVHDYGTFRRTVWNEQIRPEYRAQSALKLSAGGALVPEGFVQNLEIALLNYDGIGQAADVIRTSEGNPLPWPTINDTSNTGSLIQENVAITETAVTVGAITFSAHKISSDLVLVPVELMEDSAFNLAGYLSDILGTRIARKKNTLCTTGTGAGVQPMGVISAATSYAAASATAISGDDIVNLYHSVDPSYRLGAKVGFMMHDTIIATVRKLKNGMGDYMWQSGLAEGRPDRLLGQQVWINQAMDSTIASGKKTILFGDFSKYKIREVASLRMRRLVERYADQDQEGFVAFMRLDGQLIDAGTHPIKYLSH